MKKILPALLICTLFLTLLCGCGAESKSYAPSSDSGYVANAGGSNGYYFDEAEYGYDFPAAYDGEKVDSGAWLPTGPTFSGSEKIIYTATVAVETVEFEASVDAVYALLDKYGAFLEDSYITGVNYNDDFYGRQSYRTADFTIRVPVEAYRGLVADMPVLGNVTLQQAESQNITAQFTDVESRLNAYRAEESRLLEMLESAETVEEMILIESRLSEVRYEIEYLTSSLRNMQNRVDYSTVNLTLREVRKLTEPVAVQRSYWQEVGDGIKETFSGIGDFFKELFKWIIIALPVLILLAVIALAIVLPILHAAKKKRKAAAQVPARAAAPEDEQK